jgi:hypothetical protein
MYVFRVKWSVAEALKCWPNEKNILEDPNTYVYQLNTQAMLIKSVLHNSIAMISLISGFELGSSVHEADGMSTAPRRQGH